MQIRKEEVYRMIDQLKPDELKIIHDLLERLTRHPRDNYEYDLTEKELNEIRKARERVAKGEYDTHQEIIGEYDVEYYL